MIDPFLSTSTDKPETISRMEITRMRTRRPGKRLPSNHSRASVNLIVEPGLYMLLRFQKAAVGGNYETGNQAFSIRLRFLTKRDRGLLRCVAVLARVITF